jgi:hypothetical protein
MPPLFPTDKAGWAPTKPPLFPDGAKNHLYDEANGYCWLAFVEL